MKINEIKTPDDIMVFLDENIQYGWLDINNEKHINNMKDFRRLYRTSSIEETLQSGLGTCIEQVNLMKYLFDKINIPTKMFCCRIFEPDKCNDLEKEEHMHCFILYYMNGKVYQLEHPNGDRKGIYEFDNEKGALQSIIDYYVNFSGGYPRPTDQFFEVPVGISFEEFNKYINHINDKLYLHVPTLEELDYRKRLLEDPLTMDYNKGYDVSFDGYNYENGTISFPKEKWKHWYEEFTNDKKFYYAYIVRKQDDVKVGHLNFKLNINNNYYNCGIVIESQYRGLGYSKEALELMCKVAFNEYDVNMLYDEIPESRLGARKVFESVGFKSIEDSYSIKKNGKDETIRPMYLKRK